MRHTCRWCALIRPGEWRDASYAAWRGDLPGPCTTSRPVRSGRLTRSLDRRRSCALVVSHYVVENISRFESIKTQTGGWRTHAANWQETPRRLSAADIRTVCYNFMPVLGHEPTYAGRRGTGQKRGDRIDFVALDVHPLEWPGAAGSRCDPSAISLSSKAAFSNAGKAAIVRSTNIELDTGRAWSIRRTAVTE